jgi:hypothetical protein
MQIADFRAQLEAEMQWRTDEVRFFQNLCEQIGEPEGRDKFRRALVLLLYSHFEGYCKFALSLYVSAINAAGLACSQVNSAIAAAVLHDVFVKLRDGTGKAPEFRNRLPDDSKLHRFALDREFLQRSAEIMARPVHIPDEAVNTESNLKPVVLRKNLYKLGLPHDQFASYEGDIDKLLALRNKIAHGETRTGVQVNLYDGLRDSAFRIMSGITSGITVAFDEKWFAAEVGV